MSILLAQARAQGQVKWADVAAVRAELDKQARGWLGGGVGAGHRVCVFEQVAGRGGPQRSAAAPARLHACMRTRALHHTRSCMEHS